MPVLNRIQADPNFAHRVNNMFGVKSYSLKSADWPDEVLDKAFRYIHFGQYLAKDLDAFVEAVSPANNLGIESAQREFLHRMMPSLGLREALKLIDRILRRVAFEKYLKPLARSLHKEAASSEDLDYMSTWYDNLKNAIQRPLVLLELLPKLFAHKNDFTRISNEQLRNIYDTTLHTINQFARIELKAFNQLDSMLTINDNEEQARIDEALLRSSEFTNWDDMKQTIDESRGFRSMNHRYFDFGQRNVTSHLALSEEAYIELRKSAPRLASGKVSLGCPASYVISRNDKDMIEEFYEWVTNVLDEFFFPHLDAIFANSGIPDSYREFELV